MGCGVGCARILLIVFNFIFWLSGALLLAIGIWMIVDPKSLNFLTILTVLQEHGEIFRYAAYVLIAVGGFVLIVGFFGCCGALRKNQCMLTIYIVFLVIVMLAEITAGVLAIVFREKIVTGLEKEWKLQEAKYYNKDKQSRLFKGAMDAIQEELHCCGWKGVDDYMTDCYLAKTCNASMTTSVSEFESPYAPKSCCKPTHKTCINPSPAGAPNNLFTKGCQEGIEGWLAEKTPILIGVALGIACIELFGLIFAVCLCRNVDED